MIKLDFSRVIVFGGTTEGRLIADKLNRNGKLICVCVATEYGETFLNNSDTVLVGRLDEMQMITLFREKNPSLVIDATHPYATLVTKNIREACISTGFTYARVARDSEKIEGNDFYRFNSINKIVDWLNNQEGIIFSTLGVKEVEELTRVNDYKHRVFVRVLPVESSLKTCFEAGFDRSHVIDAMGPFSYEDNVKMMQEISADILVTKESGKAGGFAEKIKAAVDNNMKIAIYTRPDEDKSSDVFNVEDILACID